MKRYFIWAAVLVVLGAAFLAAKQVNAQKPTPSDDEVNAVARQLYCPVCENIPLDVCPTQACAQWRALIREKLAGGWSAQQIKDYFATQYGDRVLAEPPARGLNWIVYILPPLIILAGGVLVFFILRGMRARQSNPGFTPPTNSMKAGQAGSADDYMRRLEDELRKRERE